MRRIGEASVYAASQIAPEVLEFEEGDPFAGVAGTSLHEAVTASLTEEARDDDEQVDNTSTTEV